MYIRNFKEVFFTITKISQPFHCQQQAAVSKHFCMYVIRKNLFNHKPYQRKKHLLRYSSVAFELVYILNTRKLQAGVDVLKTLIQFDISCQVFDVDGPFQFYGITFYLVFVTWCLMYLLCKVKNINAHYTVYQTLQKKT